MLARDRQADKAMNNCICSFSHNCCKKQLAVVLSKIESRLQPLITSINLNKPDIRVPFEVNYPAFPVILPQNSGIASGLLRSPDVWLQLLRVWFVRPCFALAAGPRHRHIHPARRLFPHNMLIALHGRHRK
ncbi:hypothetical protein ACTJJ7_11015 [Phyllobacterium sp. 22229]|uniref:hypothetical protein n=1 Tax=Phyllobacterium sp. 22229 TaxID=3453895 RepID=UPI003F827299